VERLRNGIFAGFFGLVLLFLLFPMFIIVPISFIDSQFLAFPPEKLSLRWYRNYFSDPAYLDATIVSFQVALGTTVLATLLGTLAALGMSRTKFPGKTALYGLLIAPLIIPVIILALGVFIVFAKLRLLENIPALIAAHTVLALPYSVLIVSATLQHFDVTIERAARVLGAGPIRAFVYVTFPYIRPAVFVSAVFGFFVSFDELLIALFVTGRFDTLPKRIWADLRLEIDPTIAAVASLLIGLTLVAMSGVEILRRRAVRRHQMR
jgi:putative spermidine/putrescine transport system permease protein